MDENWKMDAHRHLVISMSVPNCTCSKRVQQVRTKQRNTASISTIMYSWNSRLMGKQKHLQKALRTVMSKKSALANGYGTISLAIKFFSWMSSLPEWQFASLDAAIAEAKKWSNASVRDLQSTGWVWNNYPSFQVYQNEITLDSWKFLTLNEAVAEAKKWGGAHIIDLNSNKWIWDNISSEDKASATHWQVMYTRCIKVHFQHIIGNLHP